MSRLFTTYFMLGIAMHVFWMIEFKIWGYLSSMLNDGSKRCILILQLFIVLNLLIDWLIDWLEKFFANFKVAAEFQRDEHFQCEENQLLSNQQV